jgi:transposase-like protein
MKPGVPSCPRCKNTAGVVEEEQTGSSLRWFVCRLCFHVWSAPRESPQR